VTDPSVTETATYTYGGFDRHDSGFERHPPRVGAG